MRTSQIGWMFEGLVLCNTCATDKQKASAIRLFRDNVVPYKQSCHGCDGVLNQGADGYPELFPKPTWKNVDPDPSVKLHEGERVRITNRAPVLPDGAVPAVYHEPVEGKVVSATYFDGHGWIVEYDVDGQLFTVKQIEHSAKIEVLRE
jgi:hypothetical protein